MAFQALRSIQGSRLHQTWHRPNDEGGNFFLCLARLFRVLFEASGCMLGCVCHGNEKVGACPSLIYSLLDTLRNTAFASHTRYSNTSLSTMPSSKFTEILDPNFQSTSPRSDVRLEDIIAATEARGRTSSETSSHSESSSDSRQNSGERTEQKPKRRSRFLSISKR